jgi:hypothetical protein
MKTKQEIEKLADEYSEIGKEAGLTFKEHTLENIVFINGYTQCQEDNKDKKYSEKDIIWAIQEAYGHGRDEADDILYQQVEESIRVILKSLNKPNNEN